MRAPDGLPSHVVVERGDLFGLGAFVVVGPKGAESQPFRDRKTAEAWARKRRAEWARRHEAEATPRDRVEAAYERRRRRVR